MTYIRESRARSYGMATTCPAQRYGSFRNQQINQLQIWRILESLTEGGAEWRMGYVFESEEGEEANSNS
jgi:hypothetical protein